MMLVVASSFECAGRPLATLIARFEDERCHSSFSAWIAQNHFPQTPHWWLANASASLIQRRLRLASPNRFRSSVHSFLATWSLLVRGFYALGVNWGYGKIREGRMSALIAVHIPINAETVEVSLSTDFSDFATDQLPTEKKWGCEREAEPTVCKN